MDEEDERLPTADQITALIAGGMGPSSGEGSPPNQGASKQNSNKSGADDDELGGGAKAESGDSEPEPVDRARWEYQIKLAKSPGLKGVDLSGLGDAELKRLGEMALETNRARVSEKQSVAAAKRASGKEEQGDDDGDGSDDPKPKPNPKLNKDKLKTSLEEDGLSSEAIENTVGVIEALESRLEAQSKQIDDLLERDRARGDQQAIQLRDRLQESFPELEDKIEWDRATRGADALVKAGVHSSAEEAIVATLVGMFPHRVASNDRSEKTGPSATPTSRKRRSSAPSFDASKPPSMTEVVKAVSSGNESAKRVARERYRKHQAAHEKYLADARKKTAKTKG